MNKKSYSHLFASRLPFENAKSRPSISDFGSWRISDDLDVNKRNFSSPSLDFDLRLEGMFLVLVSRRQNNYVPKEGRIGKILSGQTE